MGHLGGHQHDNCAVDIALLGMEYRMAVKQWD